MSKNYFDDVAESYDYTRYIPDRVLTKIANFLIKLGGMNDSSKILDIGVGTGRTALPFVKQGYNYVGVDISNNMLKRFVSKLNNEIPENLTLIHQDGNEMNFMDKSFTHILSYHVLYFIDDKVKMLNNINRMLKDGGTYFHCDEVLIKNTWLDDLTRKWYELASEKEPELKQLLETSNPAISDKEDAVLKLVNEIENIGFKIQLEKGPIWVEKIKKKDYLYYFETRRDIYTENLDEGEWEELIDQWRGIINQEWSDKDEHFIRKQLYVIKYIK